MGTETPCEPASPSSLSHTMTGVGRTRAGRINIDGIRRLTMPFVGQVEGEGRFLNVTVCTFKLRKLEFSYSGNATKRSRGCIISQLLVAINCILMVNTYAD